MGHGVPQLRLRLEPLPRRVRPLHANCLARHPGTGMRSGFQPETRDLGLRLQPAGQRDRQAAILGFQFSVGVFSAWSITRTSTVSLRASTLSPICSSIDVMKALSTSIRSFGFAAAMVDMS